MSDHLKFEDWVKCLFDREVTVPAWYWSNEWPELSAADFIEFGTRLFRRSGELLKPYSDGQINDGLYAIISNNVSDDIFALKDPSIPLGQRVAFLEAIFELNRDCFVPRCTPHLSYLDWVGAPEKHALSPLNSICYMCWDIFIIYGDREDKALDPLNRACLRVMEKSVRLSNIAVQEGAFHGLGHFALYYPEECAAIIDAFLAEETILPPKLLEYALGARTGGVL